MSVPTKLLRFPDVQARVGYTRVHIDRLERGGRFPKRVQIGARAVAWVESEIEDWLRRKMDSREEVATKNKEIGRSLAEARARASAKKRTEGQINATQ
ncbi:helix-turn-helix transcriptional regulator [Azospirillum picis]|uniref:DNA-binding transcriptional regulator AlpA n=1 Tax=Azospirillum picis TaxID=488438 RepID=A0ABU0MRT5_9PROT|nr:AlpA family phage regulatory protein [Azospirillum picis]MBP2302563.1 putative DNA-binding transcriptional regulator AlpA [Azospirillum picis]MDQ0536195.1 putative DNA-binding transcriptional regulator AlpA [Azospirillum picis]